MAFSNTNAWREILARVLNGFKLEADTYPDWLVNPETGRHLKLDLWYTEIGVACHFEGLRAKGSPKRVSLQEEELQQTRETARDELCRQRGIRLVTIDVVAGEPRGIMRELSMALSDASRRLAQGTLPGAQKVALIEAVSQARNRLSELSRRIRTTADLQVYNDLWRDRQFVDAEPEPAPSAAARTAHTYASGMEVEHAVFGGGTVETVQVEGSDQMITVSFFDGSVRTFSAALVGDKLRPKGAAF
jgi:hypothetical protein